MSDRIHSSKSSEGNDFTRQAAKRQISFLREYWEFLRQEKHWWMAPILLLLLGAAGFLILGSSVATPFIYALF